MRTISIPISGNPVSLWSGTIDVCCIVVRDTMQISIDGICVKRASLAKDLLYWNSAKVLLVFKSLIWVGVLSNSFSGWKAMKVVIMSKTVTAGNLFYLQRVFLVFCGLILGCSVGCMVAAGR